MHPQAAAAPPLGPPNGIFKRVERAKQEWEATADALPDLICLVDADGQVLRANRTVETWNLGRVTAVTGLDFHALVHPDCNDSNCELDKFLHEALQQSSTGESASLEGYDTCLARHILVHSRPIAPEEDIAPQSTVIVVRDITDQREADLALHDYTQRLETLNAIKRAILAARSSQEIAQASLSRLRQLVPFLQARVTLQEASGDAFLVLAADANGKTQVRPTRILPQEAFLGNQMRQPTRFFLIDDLTRLEDLSQVERQLVANGVRCYFSVPMIAESQFIGALSLGSHRSGFFTQQHVEIAREVADLLAIATRQAWLYERLQQVNQELQEALEAKDEMLRNVSHELRTPVSIMQAYTDYLKEGMLGPLNVQQADALGILEDQGERLLFMVSRLLTLQTLDRKALQKLTIGLAPLLQDAVRSWKVRGEKVAVSLRVEVEAGLPQISADPNLLGQVLFNLLDNAIKFSPRGGEVVLHAQRTGHRLQISVADQGIGIASEGLERVFDRFYQVKDGLSRPYGGMGIGLALCKAIVKAHDGRIWAESAGEGQGSTFCFELPLDVP